MGDELRSNDQPKTAEGDPPDVAVTVSPDVLEIEYVYETLAHPRRRYLCYMLLEDTKWTLPELATKLAAWEYSIPEDAVTDHQRNRVSTSLFNAHIPKLVADKIIEFDAESDTITYGPKARQVLNALEGICASVDTNREYYARG